jgi:hypothetical protein
MHSVFPRLKVAALSAAFALSLLPASAAVDYSAQIKPLLQQHCVKCHGQHSQKNQLRLDTAAAALAGGDSGPAIVAGDSQRSLLIQVVAGTHASIPKMPYKRTPLDSADVKLLSQWIDEGALFPTTETPSDDRHWSFIPPQSPPPPGDGNLHPIDAFLLERLDQTGIKPSPEAEPLTLLRRIHLDLIGLPPTLEQIEAFLSASKQDPAAALTTVIDNLLDSPHYGERWGRWWLDQARYGDSNGYSIDAPRQMWKYRDWVIQALNADLPFDQFTIHQIAGDLLPNATLDQRIATGFHRNTQINQEGGIDKEQFRIESVFDRVATTGAVWLGLSTGCAQCHDHKFDPISHREYFGLFALFNNQDEPTLTVPDPSIDTARLNTEKTQLITQLKAHLQTKQQDLTAWEQQLTPATRQRLSAAAIKALAQPATQRSFDHQRLLYAAMAGTSDSLFNPLQSRLTEIESALKQGTTTLVLSELPTPRTTRLFIKGDFTRPAEEVAPAVPAVLHPIESSGPLPSRLDFARWLVSKNNPLTARVIMNRVWQQYFGLGLVETENDFGTQGSLPSHPQLLDWLATEFMQRDWSLKAMHRVIVNSAAYRRSSHARPDLAIKDANNLLLARQNRLRLDAEIIRDVALTASHLLAPTLGGPPVFPPIPDGVMGLGQVKREWKPSTGADRYRRALYTFLYRSTPPPSLGVFDAPDGFATCTRRIRSNTPLQSLTLLNDPAFVEFAEALAGLIQRDGISSAFQRVLTRTPRSDELALLTPLPPLSAARVLLNLDESITRE